jgi:aspartate aminotransferase-like enzyme
MEAVVANLLEPGDKIVVGVNGIWGERVSDLAGVFPVLMTMWGTDGDRCVAERQMSG